MINELTLLSGNDIPIEAANLLLHVPTIKEIAYMGEEWFFTQCEFLRFSKNKLSTEDRNHLESLSNFEIIMSIMRENNIREKISIDSITTILSLFFPIYDINIDLQNMEIIFIHENVQLKLNKDNYHNFVSVLDQILCVDGSEPSNGDYNPSGDLARQIADKLRDRQAKLAMLKQNDNQKIAILSRYISILAVGEHKDMNSLLNYTIYQLFDEYKRFVMKLNWDSFMQARLAGAQDLKPVDDWMKDIHSDIDNEN